jgi:MFS family permease
MSAGFSVAVGIRRISDCITMFIVTALSLLLLVYIGAGEGRRTYEQLEIEKLISQGRTLQNSLETKLRAGLPLKQFAGFTPLVDGIVNGIDEVDAVAVYDRSGHQIFMVVDRKNPKLPPPSSAIKRVKENIELDRGETHTQVVFPLRSRFETVGSLVVMASRAGLLERLKTNFMPLVYVVLIVSAIFALVVWMVTPYLARTRTPWLQIGYAFTFLITAGAVVGTLVSLYAGAVQGKVHASAFTLSQRLSDIVEFNLKFEDVEGIDKIFADYKRLNPEISDAALVVDGIVKIAANAAKIGKPWSSNSQNFEYGINLERSDKMGTATLSVSAPRAVVYDQVQRSVRSFAALFVASAFLAGLFLQVANSMHRLLAGLKSTIAVAPNSSDEAGLIIVRPIFFLAVFLEHLLYSFLPKFMQDVALGSGVSVAYAAAPFTAYYLCFALALIPAGRFAEKRGPRTLIWSGLILASVGVFGLSLPFNIWEMIVLRGIAGTGQGMLFIGIQAYILAVASPEKKTQGAAIIVFGFQGGMISGMAIGSLLVNYLQPYGVFIIATLIGLAAAAYSSLLIPRVVDQSSAQGQRRGPELGILKDLKVVLRDGEFLKTMFCIGVPAKAILTGTITFALPLLLGQHGFRLEDIGQIIMLYAMSVVAASTVVARMVDRTGNTVAILFWGTAICGAGLVLVGLLGSPAIGRGLFESAIVILGVILIGVAHGFINAPVVTHVANSPIAKELGSNSVTATYRFVERIGHVAGPMMVAQLFLIWGQSPHILTGIGIATVVLGLLFLIRITPSQLHAVGPEVAK